MPSHDDQVPAFPALSIETLSGDARLQAERLLAGCSTRIIAAAEALPDEYAEEAVTDLSATFRAIRAEVADKHGELGRMAFRDALQLLGYFTRRQEAIIAARTREAHHVDA